MNNQQRAHDFAIAVVQTVLNNVKSFDELKDDIDKIDDSSKQSLFNVYVHAYNSFLHRLDDQN